MTKYPGKAFNTMVQFSENVLKKLLLGVKRPFSAAISKYIVICVPCTPYFNACICCNLINIVVIINKLSIPVNYPIFTKNIHCRITKLPSMFVYNDAVSELRRNMTYVSISTLLFTDLIYFYCKIFVFTWTVKLRMHLLFALNVIGTSCKCLGTIS